jgi:hypothetical protein
VTSTRAARAAAALFIATAALFVIGVSTEPRHDETTEATESTGTHDESTEAGGAHDDATEGGLDESAGALSEQGEDETVLGIKVESPTPIAVAVIVSLALAAGLWFRPLRPVALAAIVFALLFTALDIAEVVHQLDENRAGYAILAAVIAAGHVLAGGESTLVARRPPAPRSTP